MTDAPDPLKDEKVQVLVADLVDWVRHQGCGVDEAVEAMGIFIAGTISVVSNDRCHAQLGVDLLAQMIRNRVREHMKESVN